MADNLALNLIAAVMQWDNETATREYRWLQLMSSVKYDGYADFRAGVRFLESLVTWLKQFEPEDRLAAYDLVKNRLVYISTAEMQRVVEVFIPEVVTPYLREVVAKEIGIKPYQVWGNKTGAEAFKDRLRRCLFVGLSDGSRIDVLRRSNAGKLSQEQILPMLNTDNSKWKDLGKNLCEECGANAKFTDVYLIDDFTASGTTFARLKESNWKGKLAKFDDLVRQAKSELKDEFPLKEKYYLHIHHYVSTDQACAALEKRVREYQKRSDCTFGKVVLTEGMRLPPELKLGKMKADGTNMEADNLNDASALGICEKYYDHGLYLRLKKHCDEAGQSHMKYGYANCALPLVLEHNTPNNAISLLWAETAGEHGHPMRPLFHRRDRHG